MNFGSGVLPQQVQLTDLDYYQHQTFNAEVYLYMA